MSLNHYTTPQKENEALSFGTPSETRTPLTSPMKLQEVGPTPQLSGRVLGIFDAQALSPFRTPTKSSTPNGLFSASKSGGLEDCQVITTPNSSKRKLDDDTIPHTPQSNVSTPMQTPRKSPNAIAATPKYFHQSTLVVESKLDSEGSESDDDFPIGRQRAKRGLSSIIAELREIKEQHLDEEEEILREIENDSIDPDMLGEVQGDEDELDPEKPEGFKVYKKKGQKRTTRRHVMRPNEAPSSGLEDCAEIPSKARKPAKPQANFKRLKLNNSGYKGKPNFFKRRR